MTAERGGVCLDDDYLGPTVYHRMRCQHGHVWQAAAGSVKNAGRWCPSCAILNTIRAKNQYKRKRYESAPAND